jgi:hypothetical protein
LGRFFFGRTKSELAKPEQRAVDVRPLIDRVANAVEKLLGESICHAEKAGYSAARVVAPDD